MTIRDLMVSRRISQSELIERSGLAGSTVRDILSGRTRMRNSKATTLAALSAALDEPLMKLLELDPVEPGTPDEIVYSMPQQKWAEYASLRSTYVELYNTRDAIAFADFINMSQSIDYYFDEGQYAAAFLLLGLLDYICDAKHIVRKKQYDWLREGRMNRPVFPLLPNYGEPNTQAKSVLLCSAIPQLRCFNIIENSSSLRKY